MKLLYRTAEWHGLAKLRIHTEGSLELLEQLTKELGSLLRDFSKTTSTDFKTYELPREVQERQRRALAQGPTQSIVRDRSVAVPDERQATSSLSSQTTTTTSTTSTPTSAIPEPSSTSKNGRREKMFNLSTVKLHFLGDYVRSIRLFGTTDSYSTQIVCVVLNISRYDANCKVSRESLLIASSKNSIL